MNADVRLTNRETWGVLRRALQFTRGLRGRFGLKLLLGVLSHTPIWLLPFPIKLLIDTVLQHIPLERGHYPAFFMPFVHSLYGASPTTIVLAVSALVVGTLLLFGGWSQWDQHRLTMVPLFGQNANALAQGNDIASQAQNAANAGESSGSGLVGWLEYLVHLRLSQEINHRFRSLVFERLQRLPLTALDDQRIGDGVFRLLYDTPSVMVICGALVFTPFFSLFNMLVTAWLMSIQFPGHLTFLWVALAVIPLTLLLTLPMSRAVRATSARARAAGSTITSTLEEGVSNILAVQALGAQAHERKRFEAESWESYRGSRRLYVTLVGLMWVAFLASASGLGLIVYYDVTDALFAREITAADVGVLLAFFANMAFSARALAGCWILLQDAAIGAKRAFQLLDAASDPQPVAPRAMPALTEGYRFEDVSFEYPDGTPALTGINLEARRGTMVALVGPAGAGKTSLAYMFPRFLSPSRGRILVDGHDLASIDREALRKQIAFVFQEPVLFDATVAENIRLGKLDATDDEVRHAAEVAGAAEFIDRMPEGYATRLGRGGGRLSVGQKQRLSIARALLRGSPVLVLDEPTAALDPETEFHLVHALREASRDRLVIVIAHRLSTIRHADQIVFLRDGAIHEAGSHEELMARPGGAYRKFVELQAGGAAA